MLKITKLVDNGSFKKCNDHYIARSKSLGHCTILVAIISVANLECSNLKCPFGAHLEKSFDSDRGSGNKQVCITDEGVLHGPAIYWYENGIKRKQTNYKQGKTDGILEEWYSNGKKSIEMNFESGKPTGKRIQWHPNGRKLVEGYYEDGVPKWSNPKKDYKEPFFYCWDESGKIVYCPWIYHKETGKLNELGNWGRETGDGANKLTN